MKKMKKLGALLLTMALSASLAMPAFAATDYTEVDSVKISITSTIEAGSDEWEVEVDTTTSGVSIDNDEDVTVTNAPDDGDAWGEDIKPKVTVVLRIDDTDEYRFASGIKKTDIEVSGEEATVSSVSRNSKSKLTVKLTLPKLEYEEGYWDDLLEIADAEWGEDDGVAHWDENENAKRYELKVYRGSTSLAGTIKTTDTEYDLSKYFTKKGEYTFKVRAVYDDSNKGDWYESDELDLDSDEAEDILNNGGNSSSSSSSSSSSGSTAGPNTTSADGAWLRDNVGWWWCNADRTYPSSTWKLINNKWYYFNASGYCVQNSWVQTNNIWYYCGPDGDMWVSRWTPDGYYVNADGAWVQ